MFIIIGLGLVIMLSIRFMEGVLYMDLRLMVMFLSMERGLVVGVFLT